MKRRHWIFDMDGTLTLATHDFEEIRKTLGLPPGKPILEQLSTMPPDSAATLHQQLDDIERQHALAARTQKGAKELLGALSSANAKLGIATRNTAEMAMLTLMGCGIDEHFHPDHILGRDCAAPKPDAAALVTLMSSWGAEPQDTVMVGDYLFDLQAGKSAGCMTIAINLRGEFLWPDLADYCVTSLAEIQTLPVFPT